MKAKVIWSLLGVNLALLLALVLPHLRDNSAMAQAGVDRGEYLLIPGRISGSDSGVVYILNESDHLLGAMAYEDGKGKISVMPPLDLMRVFSDQGSPDDNANRRRR